MSLWESLRIALRSLRANAMRSVLTMLGIIIGITSVIAMVAIGAGAQARIAEQIRSLGANVLMVQPGPSRGGTAGGTTAETLTEDDAAAIGEGIAEVAATAPSARADAQVIHGNRNWYTGVNGTTADYFAIREWPVAAGRHFAGREERQAGKVALIGATVAERLFEGADPVGREIRIASVPFKVVGVLAEKGPSGSGRDQDDIVFVPISTYKLRLVGTRGRVDQGSVDYVLAKAVSNEAVPAAQAQIAALLRQRHRVPDGEPDDFRVSDPAAAMAAQHESTRTIAWLLASIASVSLLVGGISIMNIMLVSVTERTREIGLRMAVGARRRDIRNQFLIEALTLCVIGGLIGLAGGVGVAALVAHLAGWPVFVGIDAVLFGIGFSAAVGLFFGWYPARKAARLQPVEALRVE